MKYCFLFFAFLTIQISFSQAYPEQLPDFEISTLEGEIFTQEQVQKNTNVCFIYFSPTCGHCKDAFKFLNLKANQIENANVQVYPVSSNTQEETIKFFNTYAPKIHHLKNIHILKDDNFKFADIFDVGLFPTCYLYDQDRNLVKVFEGPSEILFFLNEVE